MSSRPIRIIAEAGVNHNGSLPMAFELIEKAKEAGADFVKFQLFKAENLVAKDAMQAAYQEKSTGKKESQFEMLKRLELSHGDFFRLRDHAKKTGIQFLATPFDPESLRFLVSDLKLELLKIGSGEVTDAPLLLLAGEAGIPLILSVGMSTMDEIKEALGVLAFGMLGLRAQGVKPTRIEFEKAYGSVAGMAMLQSRLTLLHCTSEYPAPFHEVNLLAMHALHDAFGVSVGYSDHTVGISVPIASAALGAEVIEKHFTLDQKLPGPDHLASLNPNELTQMVRAVREVESALGKKEKTLGHSESKNREVARKSLVALSPIASGQEFTEKNLGVKRPGTGISPLQYWEWLGKKATRDYALDERISP